MNPPPYPIHDVAELFPLVEGQAFEDLIIDVDLNGVLTPVWLYEGRLIDGRNRQRALIAANIRRERRGEPPWQLPTREWPGGDSLVAFVMSLNLHRRHLNESQRAMLAAHAAELMEEEARHRQIAQLKKGGAPLVSIDTNGKTKGNLNKTNRSRDKAAAAANVSAPSVARAQKVRKKGGKALVDAVQSGKISVTKAASLVGKSPEEIRKAIEGEKAEVKRKAKRSALRDALGKGGGHLEKAALELERAAKAIHGYDARKTQRAIEKAQESLAADAARLLAAAGQ